jgi:Domain of unknown function (DUF4157)/L,D-transpeptidase catalytic domain
VTSDRSYASQGSPKRQTTHDHGLARQDFIPQRRPVPPPSAHFTSTLSRRPVVFAQLAISSPTDDCEREADRVAAAVVHGGLAPVVAESTHSDATAQRQMDESEPSADEEDEEREEPEDDLPEGLEPSGLILPARLPGETSTPATPALSQSDGGQLLPDGARDFMESRFGHDFSKVRIHTSPAAGAAARSINAAAFTIGQHIYFGPGRFDPSMPDGSRLLAHELTHTVQQGGGDGVIGSIERSILRRPTIHELSGSRAALLRATEAHVNLRQPQRVRIYDETSTQDYVTSAGKGTSTSRLIPQSPFQIIGKRADPTARVGKWGLQYFTWFTPGGHGFHSNICYPEPRRRRQVLLVDGTPQSHGCARLRESDAIEVYNALSVGDRVHIYDEPSFRPAP